MAFLIGLERKLYDSGMERHEMKNLTDRLKQAKQDAIDGDTWNPTMEDIS
jgi:hypothetical protein